MAGGVIAGVILAGGESRRMGRPKALLEWGPGTLIEYQAGEMTAGGVQRCVVVLGHGAEKVLPLVHRAGAEAVVNELYREGRASSVRVAAAALPEETRIVIVLNVDQPRPREVIRRLLDAHTAGGNLITVPVHGGRRGHPVVLDGSLLPQMREVREATFGLRAVTQAHAGEVREVEFPTAVVLLDLNEPAQYEAAKARYFQQVSR